MAPNEFGRSDLDFLEHTAALVAGAAENARLYEEATTRVALLTELSKLSQQIASATRIGELLPMVADHCRTLIGAAHCEIYLLEPNGRLALKAASPDRSGPLTVDSIELWLEALEAGRPLREARQPRALAETLWGKNITGTPLLMPLAVGEERLGLLCVLVDPPLPGTTSALATIGAHTAVAVKKHQLIERLQEKNLVKDFFESLSRGDGGTEELSAQASRLGVVLDHRHVLFHAIPWTLRAHAPKKGKRSRVVRDAKEGWRELAARIEAGIASAIPGAVFDHRQTSVRALLPVQGSGPEEVPDAVRRIFEEAAGDQVQQLAVGLSNVCGGLDSLRRGFEEAAAAAQIGALLGGGAGVFTYEGLGPYRYALMSDEAVRDPYRERLQRLVEYERRRGTELLGTLEAYLDTRGNMARTSRLLYIHPNTLRQRLARVERLADLDLSREDWLSLAIAVKVVKLRRMKEMALAFQEGREADD
jgi:sugar diacid utilization regulator